jgi:hypothetical protein
LSGVSEVLVGTDFHDNGSVSAEGYETIETFMTRAMFEGIDSSISRAICLILRTALVT